MTQNTLLLDTTLAKCLLGGVCIAAGLRRHCRTAHFRTLFLDLMSVHLFIYSFIGESGASYTVYCTLSALDPSHGCWHHMTVLINVFPGIPK